jgi:hypothetical protein
MIPFSRKFSKIIIINGKTLAPLLINYGLHAGEMIDLYDVLLDLEVMYQYGYKYEK